ncbi:putative uncharacterized protein DDB_G0282133 [Parasteatoda tepidariorum]|uniref:putative uncharacterized protein DDB_G0282133 n=1 Tax=Parasteatoda tepidariorum TaxID=114398 RepID=UPI001C720BB5|nr:uncharacterized protein LOC122269337 [Parasteatoda tepidariorum]
MNWVGGARSRVKAENDKKKQREFFEKQRKKTSSSNVNESLSVSTLSHDLITFYLKQRNLKKGSVPSKPLKMMKQNLDKRSNSFVLHATLPLPETPLEDNPVSKNKIMKNSWEARNSKFENGIETEMRFNGQISLNQAKTHQTSSDSEINIADIYDVENISREYAEKDTPENTNDLVNQSGNGVLEDSFFKTDRQFMDISNACRDDVADVDQLKRAGKVNDNFRTSSENVKFSPNKKDTNAFFDIFLHKTLKEINTEKPFRSKISQNQNRSKKKMKILDKMNSYLNNHEKKKKSLNAVLHKSKLSYSRISQCTVESMPLKVSRDMGRPSIAEPTYDYRRSLDDLETMIENCDLKLKKRNKSHVYDTFWTAHKGDNHDIANMSSNVQLSSTDSTSSSSSPSTIFSCAHMNIDPLHPTKYMPSYEMFQASLKQSETLKVKNGTLSHRKKFKLSNTHLKDSFGFESDFQKKLNPYGFDHANNSKSKNIQKPSSVLSYFPSPMVVRLQNLQNANPAYLIQNPLNRISNESSGLSSKTLTSRDEQNMSNVTLDIIPKPKIDVSIHSPFARCTGELSKLPSRNLRRPDLPSFCQSPLSPFSFHPTTNISCKKFSRQNMEEPTESSSNVLTTSQDSQINRISPRKAPKNRNLNISIQNSPMPRFKHSQTTPTDVLKSLYEQTTNTNSIDSKNSTRDYDESSGKYTSTSTQTRFEKVNVFTETATLNYCPTCSASKINAGTSPFLNLNINASNRTKENFNCFTNGGNAEKVSACTTKNQLDIYSNSECAKNKNFMALSDHDQNHLKNCNPYTNCNTQLETDGNGIIKYTKEEMQNEFENNKKLSSNANSPAMNEVNITSSYVADEKQMKKYSIRDQYHLENSGIITNIETKDELKDNTKESIWNEENILKTFKSAEKQRDRYSITNKNQLENSINITGIETEAETNERTKGNEINSQSNCMLGEKQLDRYAMTNQNHLENNVIITNIETEDEPRNNTKYDTSLPPTEPNSPDITIEGTIEKFPSNNALICNNEDPLPPTVPNIPILSSKNDIGVLKNCSPGTIAPRTPFLQKGVDYTEYCENCSFGSSEIRESKEFLQSGNEKSPERLKMLDEEHKAGSSLQNARQFFNAMEEGNRKSSDHAIFSNANKKCFGENMNSLPRHAILNTDLSSFKQNITDKDRRKIIERSMRGNMSRMFFDKKEENNSLHESKNNFILPFSQPSLIAMNKGCKTIADNSNVNIQEKIIVNNNKYDSGGQEKTSGIFSFANSFSETADGCCREITSNSKINMREYIMENDQNTSTGQAKIPDVLSSANSPLDTTEADCKKISGNSEVIMREYVSENDEDASSGKEKNSDVVPFPNYTLGTTEANYLKVFGNSTADMRVHFTENRDDASSNQAKISEVFSFENSSKTKETNHPKVSENSEVMREYFVENDEKTSTAQITNTDFANSSLSSTEGGSRNIDDNSAFENGKENNENSSVDKAKNSGTLPLMNYSEESADLRFANEKCRFMENDFSRQEIQVSKKKYSVLAKIDRFLKSMENNNFDSVTEAINIKQNCFLTNEGNSSTDH